MTVILARMVEGQLIPATPVQPAKRRLRRGLMAQRAALSPEQISHYSAVITSHVCAMPRFNASHTVMAYMALPQEVQLSDVIATAQQQHKRVVVPVVTAQGLIAVECPSDRRHFRRSLYGILEPRDTSVVVPPAEIDYVLVPGVGFDLRGNRLGYGAGYYDRFLKLLPATADYGGVAFHIQLVSQVPSRCHDVPMRFMVTEQGVQLCPPIHAPQLADHRVEPDGERAKQDK